MSDRPQLSTTSAYYIGTNPNSFRCGEPAKITEVASVKVGEEWRPCFLVEYADGRTDYCAISDTGNYKVVNEAGIRQAWKKE